MNENDNEQPLNELEALRRWLEGDGADGETSETTETKTTSEN